MNMAVVVLLVASIIMMQANVGTAQNNKSLTLKLQKTQLQQQPGPLSAAIPLGLLEGLTAQITIGVARPTAQLVPSTFVIDTGKTDFWIVDRTCRDGFCVNTARRAYDRLSSASFYNLGQSVNVNYFDNRYQVRGTMTLDQLTFGPTVYNQEFIRVTSTKGLTTANVFDGIMGLANRVTTRSSLNAESLIQRMVNQGVIDRRTFTISAAATTLTFGDVPTLTAPINYVNVVTRGVWNFRANSVTLDNGLRSFNVQTGPTIRIESILSNIGIPSAPLGRLAGDLRATLNPQTKQYDISCAELTATPPKNLLLTINGQIYTIPPTSYINAAVGTGPCTLNILVTREWMLGQTFLKLFDVVFDAQSNTNQIGFSIPPPTPTP